MRRAMQCAGLRVGALFWIGRLPVCAIHLQGARAGGNSIARLALFMTVLFIVITAIMWVLFAYRVLSTAGHLSEHEPIDVGGGEMWIAVGGIAHSAHRAHGALCAGTRPAARFSDSRDARRMPGRQHGAQHEAGHPDHGTSMVVGDPLSE